MDFIQNINWPIAIGALILFVVYAYAATKFKILDWYIIRKFLVTYVFVVIILMAIIVVVDFTENSEDLVKNEVEFWDAIKRYYINIIPYYANLLSPITVFIAVVFVTSRLASHTEIIAMLSGGISFKRLLYPYFMGALLLASMTTVLINWVIPEANKTRVSFEIQYLKNPFRFRDRDFHMKVSENDYVYMESYNNDIHAGYKFSLEHFDGNKLVWKMNANKIQWDKDSLLWHIDRYQIRTFNGMEETFNEGRGLDTVLNLFPKDFESTYRLAETLNVTELETYIQERINRGADDVQTYQIEKYERIMYPFAIIVLAIIGAIMSARKSRRGVGFQIVLGFVLAFLYIIFVIMSRNLAQVGDMHPALAAAFPTLVYVCLGMFLYKFVPR